MMALAQKGPLEGRRRDAEQAWTEGAILLAEGRAGESQARLHEAAEAILCVLCVLPDLARARDAKGDADGAINAYERYLSTPWLFRYEVDAYELEPALQRLAELYDVHGERNRALETRTRLLALWRRADATLQPVLADVRTASRSLTDELELKRGTPGEAPGAPAR
jgi:tetratricopeptide (TPR) repeat protein